jgi:replication factor C subunit 3/5
MNYNLTSPWFEVYRPTILNEIISQDSIIHTLQKYINNKCVPHLLFYGPPGTGKTSTIMACAKQIYGDTASSMVLQINASEERGIEVVRTTISQFVNAKPLLKNTQTDIQYKLVILDEADSMTSDAQAMLRRVIEGYTANARFCLICNYIKKINTAIQSRCTCFRFSLLNNKDIKIKMLKTIKDKQINISNDAVNCIINRSNGDMRKIFNILQSIYMAHNNIDKIIDYNTINQCLGYPSQNDINILYDSLINNTFKHSYDIIYEYKYIHGYSATDIISELHNLLVVSIKQKKSNYDNLLNICLKLRDIEFNISICTNESIQITAIIACFKVFLN